MKEKLAEQYAEENNSAYTNDYYGFLAGYEAATKWKKVEEELPNNDRTVLVWINNAQNPQWSTYGLGSYIDDNWYIRGGRETHEIVEKWIEIPL